MTEIIKYGKLSTVLLEIRLSVVELCVTWGVQYSTYVLYYFVQICTYVHVQETNIIIIYILTVCPPK